MASSCASDRIFTGCTDNPNPPVVYLIPIGPLLLFAISSFVQRAKRVHWRGEQSTCQILFRSEDSKQSDARGPTRHALNPLPTRPLLPMGFTPFPGGIAFDEVLVAPQSQRARNWFRIRDGALSLPRARSGKGTKGPRSLGAICLRVLADNIDAVSEDSLHDIIKSLPGKLTWELWKQLAPR